MVSGETTMYCDECFSTIFEQHIVVFEGLNDAKIDLTAGSEAEVLEALKSGQTRLAVLTRTLTDGEREEIIDNLKCSYNDTHVAVDAVAFVVNNANPDTVLTTDDVRRILTGEVTEWSEIFPDSKLGKIRVIFDNPQSSTVRYASQSICGEAGLYDGVIGADSTLHMISEVAKRRNAIGVMGAAWVREFDDEGNRVDNVVTPVRIKPTPDSQSFGPYQANIRTGDYPYFRSVYVINTGSSTGLTTGFTIFVAGQRGQMIVGKTNISPARIHSREVNVRSEF